MKSFIVAGNWKMNHGPMAARKFMAEFLQDYSTEIKSHVIFFPNALSWTEVSTAINQLESEGERKVFWGLQNIHPEESGAFTGETSVAMAKEIKAQYVLVGHSERRQIFKEKNDFLALKVKALQENGITPMYCVGETLEERESGEMHSVLTQQLKEGLTGVSFTKPLVIAYEPVWAIGTGKVASPVQAQEAHEFIRQTLKTLVSEESIGQNMSILYGGSVKPENAKELSQKPDVDGFLVGGASLKAKTFLQIAKNL